MSNYLSKGVSMLRNKWNPFLIKGVNMLRNYHPTIRCKGVNMCRNVRKNSLRSYSVFILF